MVLMHLKSVPLGVASSLLGGLFGKSNTNKTNEMNYRIMQEQNRFNAEEAKKNRDWQELMYRMFGTSSAKANDMRAAAPAPAEPRAVHLFKRKGAPPKAAVLLIIKSDNIDKNYLKISNKRD
jgi:hypothetical protein